MSNKNCFVVLWSVAVSLLPNIIVNDWDVDKRCLRENRSFVSFLRREFERQETNPLIRSNEETDLDEYYTPFAPDGQVIDGPPNSIDYNVVLQDEVTFNLKLHWVFGACWQEEWKERKWCIQCQGPRCGSGDSLVLKVCRNIPSQRFLWLSTNDGGDRGRIRTANDDLCFEENRGLTLQQCSSSGRQIFRRSSMHNVFELHPQGFDNYCLSQQHHPKAGEIIYAEDCVLARKYLTSKWHIYEDSAGNSDPNDDGYPGISNDGTSGPELSLRGNNCNGQNPCGICEGDCNENRHCEGNLRCFQRQAINYIPGCSGYGVLGKDYCYLPPEGRAGSKRYHEATSAEFDDRRQLKTL